MSKFRGLLELKVDRATYLWVDAGKPTSGMQSEPRARVLRLITRLNIGGPARHAITLTEKLPLYGFDGMLVSGSVGEREGKIPPPPDLNAMTLPSLGRGFNPLADARAAVAVRSLIKRFEPTIVHTHMAKAGALGRVIARAARVPIVVHTFHGHVLREYFSPPLNRTFLEVERHLARISNALIAVSTHVRNELVDLGVGRPSQWHVIPLGLDLGGLNASTLAPDEARNRIGIVLDRPLVGIVGRLAPIKDHWTFLNACAEVAKQHPTAEFVIAGDGPLRDRLEAKAREMLGDRVAFLGWVRDLEALYSALDVVVLTSRNEGTPVALIEAAACARPVVATNVGGVADVIREGVNGYLVDAGDHRAVAERVVRLLSNRDLAESLGRAGRMYVKERFSAERLVSDIAQLYSELLLAADTGHARSPAG